MKSIENVGLFVWTPKKIALTVSGILALSLFSAGIVVICMDTRPQSTYFYPDIPEYEGLLITVPTEGIGAEACEAGEVVTELPIGEIQRYLPLEEEQDYTGMHPYGFPSYYTLEGYGMYYEDYGDMVLGARLLEGDYEPLRSMPQRDLEEPDIVKLVGDTYFILNPYKGLIIVDVTNPDEPQLLGRARVHGEPVEMYVVDTMAYLVVRADYGYWHDLHIAENVAAVCDFNIGSQIIVVDVSDLWNPEIVQRFRVPGFVQDTRRVGSVLYAVSNEYSWYSKPGEVWEDKTSIVSFSIWDPSDIQEIQTIEFDGSYNQVHVTENAMFVAQPDDDIYTFREETKIVYVDISNPLGLLEVKDSYTVDGWLDNRYQMDYYNGMFRIVTHFWREMGDSELTILDVGDPSDIVFLGSLKINDAGTLMATRFDGDRAYTIHLPQRMVDPLDVLDLSDPANPKLCDVLEIPGWITHMEVRGYKIVAVGVDDTSEKLKVALSLFDVADPYNAILLDRVILGDGWSWSTANTDPRTVSVLDDLEMIVVPFTSHFADENGWWKSANAIQLVDFDLTSGELTVRGLVNTPSSASRTRHYADRILATSDRSLQVIDFADRDNPEVTAIVELAAYVLDYVKMDDSFVRLVQHDTYGNLWLETMPTGSEDIAAIDTGLRFGSLLVNEEFIYVIGYDHNWERQAMRIFDYSDPQNPWFRGDYYFPSEMSYGLCLADRAYSYCGSSEVVPALEDGYFAYLYQRTHYWFDDSGYVLHVVDVSNPSDPELAGKLDIRADWILNALIEDDVLYFTDVEYSYEYYEEVYRSETKDRLGRVSLADLDDPTQMSSVDIPGMLVNVEGDRIYTLASSYDRWDSPHMLNVLELDGNEADVLLSVEIEGFSNVIIENGIAYVSRSTYYWYDYQQSYFTVMDLTDVEDPVIVADFEIPEHTYLLQVERGLAILRSYSGSFYIFDVTDEPSFFGIHHSSSWVFQIRIYDDQIYFIKGYYGIEIVDVS